MEARSMRLDLVGMTDEPISSPRTMKRQAERQMSLSLSADHFQDEPQPSPRTKERQMNLLLSREHAQDEPQASPRVQRESIASTVGSIGLPQRPTGHPSFARRGSEHERLMFHGEGKRLNKNAASIVNKMDDMERKREERRRLADEEKQRKAAEDLAIASRSGISVDSVAFVKQIAAYRTQLGVQAQPTRCGSDATVWDSGNSSAADSRIRVVVRKRPMLQSEREALQFDSITVLPPLSAAASSGTTPAFGTADTPGLPTLSAVHEARKRVDETKEIQTHEFQFDAAFSELDTNAEIFKAVGLPALVTHVVEQKPATVLCFGQTNSGKTVTMLGLTGREDGKNGCGLFSMATREVFEQVAAAAKKTGALRASVFVSFYEIYRGQAFDLLNARQHLAVRDNGKGRTIVAGLLHAEAVTAVAVEELVAIASRERSVGSTSANAQSSRSHAILQLRVCASPAVAAAVRQDGAAAAGGGKLNLIDLAGSERAADAASEEQQTRLEGAEINKSLLVLKECIRAIDSHKTHTPFRGSKLTHVLREAFSGEARMVFIANLSPGSGSTEHSLNTLRYAARVKDFKPPGLVSGSSGWSAMRARHAKLQQLEQLERGSRSSPSDQQPGPLTPPLTPHTMPPERHLPPLPLAALAVSKLKHRAASTKLALARDSVDSRPPVESEAAHELLHLTAEESEAAAGAVDPADADSDDGLTLLVPNIATGALPPGGSAVRDEVYAEELVSLAAEVALVTEEEVRRSDALLELEVASALQQALPSNAGGESDDGSDDAGRPAARALPTLAAVAAQARSVGQWFGQLKRRIKGPVRRQPPAPVPRPPPPKQDPPPRVMSLPFASGVPVTFPASSKPDPRGHAAKESEQRSSASSGKVHGAAHAVVEYMRSIATLSETEQLLFEQHRLTVSADEAIHAQGCILLDEMTRHDGHASTEAYVEDLEVIIRAKIELAVRMDAQLKRFKQQLAREENAHKQLDILVPEKAGKRVMRALPFTTGTGSQAKLTELNVAAASKVGSATQADASAYVA